MFTLIAALILQSAPGVAGPDPVCPLTEADRVANRTLGFSDFDQGGSDRPSTGWNLAIAGCHTEAALADEDYLLNGPVLSDYERAVVRWHMALEIAADGREAEAATLVATAVYDAEPTPDAFEWNAYVRGVWGFLRKDRPVLETALATLRAAPGGRNAMNARALGRLSKCFDRPYAEASRSEACAVE